MRPFYGDIHNHCGISYGHGTLAEALANARERLDFVSITGHAAWPDMPDPEQEPRLRPIIDFHRRGFARLREVWPDLLRELRSADREGEFVVFPGFEIHSCAHGDRNVLFRDLGEDAVIPYPDSIPDLHRRLAELRDRGVETLSQPHHVGYRRGTRGIDWASHDPDHEPLVELVSMHGCSEASESARPFLHVMGPSDVEGTIRHGWERGHVFGVTGGTDHHSAHPGSYGHGLLGLWAEGLTRGAIWEAFRSRRTWAMTGDRIALDCRVDGVWMGGVVPPGPGRRLSLDIAAGAAIDAVEVRHNNRLVRRFSPELDHRPVSAVLPSLVHTKLHFELGWGPRGVRVDWRGVACGIREGRVLGVEPRFRGREVVSPLESEEDSGFFESRVVRRDGQGVVFDTVTRGNPNNLTNASQGICLEVEMPPDAEVFAEWEGGSVAFPLRALIHGARAGLTAGLESPAWRWHRAPLPHEWRFQAELPVDLAAGDWIDVRVRQTNDQWAWGSPVFCRE